MPVYGSERWMGDIPDDQSLADVVIPGTHDSTTQYVWLAYFSKCQSQSVAEQLKAGYRYLDIRLGADQGAGKLRLMHGFVGCRTGNAVWSSNLYLDAVLADCAKFLADNPTECILFVVKKEHGTAAVSEVQQLLDEAVAASGIALLETDTIPAMGEARGKLVLLRRYEDEAGLGKRAGVPFIWEDQPKDGLDYVSPPYKTSENGGFTLQVQDRYEYNTNTKWMAFTESLSGGDVTVDFLSTKGTAKYGHPYRFARSLNKKLLKADLASEPGIDGGVWMIVDFGSPKLAEKIWRMNFPEE
ncbi:MAG: hypothetical protein IKR59_05580, partial [Lachnospiraceae bacterium]|nr:hypothetical protein [Lachnospiraceae bacterium]